MTTSCIPLPEAAIHAEAITGTSAQEIAGDFLADKQIIHMNSQRTVHNELNSVKAANYLQSCLHSRNAVTKYNTTLLRGSRIFSDVEIQGDTMSLWFALDKADYMADSPRQALEKVASLASVEDSRALLQFLAKNKALGPVLVNAAEEILKLDDHVSTEITVFGEPDENDYCLYINTLLSVDSYDKAYELEEAVFNKVIDPHFDLVDFKIVLAFDTDSDD